MDLQEHPKPRSTLTNIFISPEEPRLRAGWRLLIHGCLILFFLIPPSTLIFIILLVTRQLDVLLDPSLSLFLVNAIVMLVALLPATFLARLLIDRRSFKSLGFTIDGNTLKDLLVGFAIPGILMGVIYIVERRMGWLKFEGWGGDNTGSLESLGLILLYFLVFTAVGFYEELLARGYYLQNLKDGINLPAALGLSSIFFAIGHITNPNGSIKAVLFLIFAGLFLAFCWFRTQSLWLPIGVHIGWNFFEGPVFGFPVSGTETFSIIRINDLGPEWFTGGAFGPEAGAIILPILILGSLMVWLYTRDRKTLQSEQNSLS